MKNTLQHFPYIDRDISWMFFNARVLQEASRQDVPLLERLNYLGIYSNNLDEFYRVRMASDARLAEMRRAAVRDRAEAAKILVQRLQQLDAGYSAVYHKEVHAVLEELKSRTLNLLVKRICRTLTGTSSGNGSARLWQALLIRSG